MTEPTYGHGVSKMDVHHKTCEANPEDHSWLLFTPPDDVIPSCPQCHDVIFGVTVILDESPDIAHPCHHELSMSEVEEMMAKAIHE